MPSQILWIFFLLPALRAEAVTVQVQLYDQGSPALQSFQDPVSVSAVIGNVSASADLATGTLAAAELGSNGYAYAKSQIANEGVYFSGPGPTAHVTLGMTWKAVFSRAGAGGITAQGSLSVARDGVHFSDSAGLSYTENPQSTPNPKTTPTVTGGGQATLYTATPSALEVLFNVSFDAPVNKRVGLTSTLTSNSNGTGTLSSSGVAKLYITVPAGYSMSSDSGVLLSAVPLPAGVWLFLSSLGFLAWLKRR